MSELTVASLNTRGVPPFGSRLNDRYRAIAGIFEASDVDVVNLQEVLTYHHLRQLVRSMPSYRFVSLRRLPSGPAGGLVTLSRTPIVASSYRRFPLPSAADADGLPRLSRLVASLKGVLITRLANVGLVNTHLLANLDGDWTESNRFYRLLRGQLGALSQYVATVGQPAILSGDFNVARDSELYREFLRTTGFVDAFGDTCPPTFHPAYLQAGQTPHCIDFVLLSDASITVEAADLTFTGKLPMRGGHGYLTDHLGLQVRLAL